MKFLRPTPITTVMKIWKLEYKITVNGSVFTWGTITSVRPLPYIVLETLSPSLLILSLSEGEIVIRKP